MVFELERQGGGENLLRGGKEYLCGGGKKKIQID